jgi:hypothetical protein
VADALHTAGLAGAPGPTSAADARLADAGLIATHAAGMAVRTGILYGPGAATLVTGTASTAPMTVNVAAHHWVTTRGTADGVYRGAAETVRTVNIAAAPAANSRIDVVYVKQNDAASTVSPDGTTGDVYDVAQGTAAATPTKPAIPVGALELATLTIAAGATSTNGAGVTIANTARLTVARGARIPVRNQAERDALTGYPGLEVWRLDSDATQIQGAAGTWRTVDQPTLGYSGTVTAGSAAPASGATTEFTTSTVAVADPGYTYRLLISAALVITQNVTDSRIDLRVYDGTTLIMAASKSSTETASQYSTELAQRPYPLFTTGGLTGARTLTLRIGRYLAAAVTAFAVVNDPIINHFTIRVIPA